jgi:outer membrane protein TolC
MKPAPILLLSTILLLAPFASGTSHAEELTAFETRFAAVNARPGGLVASAVAASALRSSHDVRARVADVEVAASGTTLVWKTFLPSVGVTARYTRLSPIEAAPIGTVVVAPTAGLGVLPPGSPLVNAPIRFDVPTSQALVQGTLTVPLSDYLLRLPPALAASAANERLAALRVKATERQITVESYRAYYGWVRARLQVIVAEEALAQAQAHLADARANLAVAKASPADVARVEATVAAATLAVERARNLAALTDDRLHTLMHDPGDASASGGAAGASGASFAIGEDVARALEPFAVTELSKLWNEALGGRPEIAAMVAAIEAERQQAKLQRAAMAPRVDLFADAIYANPTPRVLPAETTFRFTWDVGVQLTWSTRDLLVGDQSGKSADARITSLDEQRLALVDAVHVQVTQAYLTVREADTAVTTTKQALVASEEAYRVRRDLFANGRATSTELLDAELAVTQARLDAIGARLDQRVARANLTVALGRPLA